LPPFEKGVGGLIFARVMFIKSNKFLPYNKELNKKAKNLRNEMTAAEKKLWYEYLRNHRFQFLRQRPIDNYIVDFPACRQAGIALN